MNTENRSIVSTIKMILDKASAKAKQNKTQKKETTV